MPHTLCPGRGVPMGWIWGLFAGYRISPTAVPGVKPLEQWPTVRERSAQLALAGALQVENGPGATRRVAQLIRLRTNSEARYS